MLRGASSCRSRRRRTGTRLRRSPRTRARRRRLGLPNGRYRWISRDIFVGCQHGQRPRLSECDDDSIEWIPVKGWQGRGGTRRHRVKREFMQCIALCQAEKPLDRRLGELKSAGGCLNGHLPGGNDRHTRLRRAAQCSRSRIRQLAARERQKRTRIQEDIHRQRAWGGHSSSLNGSVGSKPCTNVTRKRGSGSRFRTVRRLLRRRISATSIPSRQITTTSLRSSTARTSSERRVLASCMFTAIIIS